MQYAQNCFGWTLRQQGPLAVTTSLDNTTQVFSGDLNDPRIDF